MNGFLYSIKIHVNFSIDYQAAEKVPIY